MTTYFGLNATTFNKFAKDLGRDQYLYGTLICVPIGNH